MSAQNTNETFAVASRSIANRMITIDRSYAISRRAFAFRVFGREAFSIFPSTLFSKKIFARHCSVVLWCNFIIEIA